MVLGEQVERVFAQPRQDAGRMAEPHRLFAVGDQPLQQVIDRQVARRTSEHLVAAADCLADQLDDGRRLAGAGWAVDDGHIVRRQGKLHGLALRLVQRGVERGEFRRGRERGRRLSEQDGPQFGETVAFGSAGAFQCRALTQSGGLVVGEIDAVDRRVAVVVRRFIEGDPQIRVGALGDDAAPAGAGLAAVRRQHDGRPGTEARPGERLPRSLRQRQDEAAAETGELLADDQIGQTGAGTLGILGGESADALERLAHLGFGLQFEQVAQASEVIVGRWVGHDRQRVIV